MIENIRKNQQKIALVLGYALVFLCAFGLGRITKSLPQTPEITVDESGIGPSQANNNPDIKGVQSEASTPAAPSITSPVNGDCGGKIKGNIGSSGNIYHMPGGSFYDRTSAERCFSTEAEAQAAGFRKSKQ